MPSWVNIYFYLARTKISNWDNGEDVENNLPVCRWRIYYIMLRLKHSANTAFTCKQNNVFPYVITVLRLSKSRVNMKHNTPCKVASLEEKQFHCLKLRRKAVTLINVDPICLLSTSRQLVTTFQWVREEEKRILKNLIKTTRTSLPPILWNKRCVENINFLLTLEASRNKMTMHKLNVINIDRTLTFI